jgi:hypothetical protein
MPLAPCHTVPAADALALAIDSTGAEAQGTATVPVYLVSCP